MPVAEIRGLSVRYGSFVALKDLTVVIPDGCTGLLGPNGSGKTTLLRTMLGFIAPASGGGAVMGADVRTQGPLIRQRVGLMPEQDCHIPGMSAVQFVAYAGELAGMPAEQALRRAHEVLEYCGLGEARYRNVETYSTGMKQRIKLAQALVHGPRLLLLDEPTNGLDPRGRQEMLELIRSISHGKGVNVLVSSHLLPDIERTCDEVIVIFRGELKAQGLVRDLRRLDGRPVDVELREPSGAFLAETMARGLRLLESSGSRYRFAGGDSPAATMRAALESAAKTGAQVRGYQPAQRSLEEAFLEAVSG
jgi:ABC-2 type transport system ATP-binding protein